MLYKKYISSLTNILTENNVCESHGIGHALKVFNHAINALQHTTKPNDNERKAVLLAALLHDADDKKFFPMHNNYENLRKILDDVDTETINFIIKMVELVSSSKNGDTIPDDIKDKEWMLIPRYADRLEAIGIIGIKRCWQYTKTINNPLFLITTLRAVDEIDLWINIATEKRYKNYNGKSASMIDHFYDKLLGLAVFPIRNVYLDNMCSERRKPLVDFALMFGKTGYIDDKIIQEFIEFA